jgi:hypothetical protein
MEDNNFKTWFMSRLENNNCRVTFEKRNGEVASILCSYPSRGGRDNTDLTEQAVVVDEHNNQEIHFMWEDLISYNFV